MGWLLALAWVSFLFWRVRRAKENAAERRASGESKSALYWIGSALALSVLALSMYMAKLKPGEISGSWWLVAVALFVATLIVRRALRWRYPH